MDKTEFFIEKSKKIHGDKYNYSKVDYVNATTKVCIICPEHGEFWQTPQVHLRGGNCPKCAFETIRNKNTKSNVDFINEAKKIHQDKYDYSKVEYINRLKEVCIICPEHGEFWQTPQVHLRGGNCPKCLRQSRAKATNEFIEDARKVHGDKYNYSKVEYINAHAKVTVICKKHGEFSVRPCNHLHGNGCPECKKETISDLKRKSIDKFKEEANIVHKHKYGYDKVVYKTTDDSITITCPIHGDYLQLPKDHLRGHGCPKCANQQSLVEDEIYDHISSVIGKENVKRRDNSILEDKRELDVFIPSLNFGIEYNGLHWHTEEFGKDRFYHVKKTDEFNSVGIKVLQIFEDEWNENKNLVINKIDHILGLQNNLPKIMARKCKIKEITKSDAELFLAKNHIQGYVPSTIHIGAYYNDTLIGVTSFTKEKENYWNLTRMATDINFICNGVCSKMLCYFKRNYRWKTIKTFADRRWTPSKSENLYTKLGFVLTKILLPDYRYVVGKKRIHKFNFRKNNIHKKYGLSLEMTEKEMMKTLKIQKIWDCGLFKYEMKNDS